MAINFVPIMFWPILVCPAAVAVEQGDQPSSREASTIAETQGEAATGDCGGSGSCCVGHGAPGCEDVSCCETVCAVESLCCLIGWTEDCATLAGILCTDVCAGTCPSEGTCCQSHSGGGCDDAECCNAVCRDTPSCCEAIWSNTCANLANKICDNCDEPPRCPTEGPCCENNPLGPGCERANCCEIVCDLDSFCCNGVWDDICGRKARESCPNICECESFGDFDLNLAVNLRDIAAFLACFTGPGNPPVAASCECADYDADDDADLDDFVFFAALLAP